MTIEQKIIEQAIKEAHQVFESDDRLGLCDSQIAPSFERIKNALLKNGCNMKLCCEENIKLACVFHKEFRNAYLNKYFSRFSP